MKKIVTVILCWSSMFTMKAQNSTDQYSVHEQATVVPQYHFNFSAPYTGTNSLQPSEQVATSVSTTVFFAYKPL